MQTRAILAVLALMCVIALSACEPDKPCMRWGTMTTFVPHMVGKSTVLFPVQTPYCEEYAK